MTAREMSKDEVYALYQRGLLVPYKAAKAEPTAREMAVQFALNKRIPIPDFFGKTRVRSVAHPRQDCMAMLAKQTDKTQAEIGQLFGRDHSTVKHAINASQKREANR